MRNFSLFLKFAFSRLRENWNVEMESFGFFFIFRFLRFFFFALSSIAKPETARHFLRGAFEGRGKFAHDMIDEKRTFIFRRWKINRIRRFSASFWRCLRIPYERNVMLTNSNFNEWKFNENLGIFTIPWV